MKNRLFLKHKDKVYHFFCSYTAMLTFTAIAIIKHGAPIGIAMPTMTATEVV